MFAPSRNACARLPPDEGLSDVTIKPDKGFEKFRAELAGLVKAFRQRRAHFKVEGYDEAQLRTDFLNPFWRALGWDIENVAGLPQSLRDVEVETRVRVLGRKKRADYVFRTGGIPKFVCEAKKATDDLTLKGAYQCQRYSFNLKIFVAVLTNFEALHIYIVGGKPDEAAPFPVYKKWSFLEYESASREIWDLFARDSVAQNSIGSLVDGLKKKPIPGKARTGWLFIPDRVRTVDEEFLDYIEQKRRELAHLLVEHNKRVEWDDASLNDCIQRIIDRLLFVRICEDRDIDTGRSLEAIVSEWQQVSFGRPSLYPVLVGHFRSLDKGFNGTLFSPGHQSEEISVPDKFLVDTIADLSSEDSPYLFSTLPVEILGSVYERFIGQVVRLTKSGSVKVEPKPEVRKAGGVYYTPRAVVNYIIEQTVGALIVGRSPEYISKLRFLDPACGSGSFLIRVFERVCEEHLLWFQRHPKEQRKAWCYLGDDGNLHLTTHLKRRIMMNNVFGVDIDFRAVEVTMLSLYLKVLEGETRSTLGRNYSLFPKETFLPDLSSNIRCGNSLLASDFYTGEQLSMMGDTAVRERVNAFDWELQFHNAAAGFDAVVGNPPYVLLQDEFRDDDQLQYFRSKYVGASYKVDTYHLFIERAIRLTKNGGRVSMITPANFLTNNYLAALRRLILDCCQINHLLVIDGGVFEGVSVDNAIFVLVAGERTTGDWPLIHVAPTETGFSELSSVRVRVANSDKTALFTGGRKSSAIWKNVLKDSLRLGQVADVNFGKQLRDRTKFPKDVIQVRGRKPPLGYRRCYTGRDIERYRVTWNGLACLDKAVARKGGCWDATRQNAKNKLLTRQIGQFPSFAIDQKGYQCLNTMFMVNVHKPYDPYQILGFLNSKLIRALWIDRFYDQRRTFPKIKGTYLEELPVFASVKKDRGEEKRIKEVGQLARLIVTLRRQLASAKGAHARNSIERQIAAGEDRIDRLVFSLYGLGVEEVEAIESIVSDLTSPANRSLGSNLNKFSNSESEVVEPSTHKLSRRRRRSAAALEQSALFE